MKIGLLIDRPLTLRETALWRGLAEAGVRGHAVTMSPASAAALQPLAAPLAIETGWEAWLSSAPVDAVWVLGDSDLLQTTARQLAQEGVPLWVSVSAKQGLTFLYELMLLQDDRKTPLAPAWDFIHQPLLGGLKQALASEALGRVPYLHLKRTVCPAAGSVGVTAAAVDELLLSDIALLRWLVGEPTQVTALRTEVDGSVLRASVTFSVPGRIELQWTLDIVSDGTSDATWDLRVPSPNGDLLVSRTSAGEYRLGGNPAVISSLALGQAEDRDAGSPGVQTLQIFLREKGSPLSASGLTWSDAVRAAELLDASERSLKRRRTIEIHWDRLSERALFKTQMAAIGCGVLFLTLALFVILSLIDGVVRFPPNVRNILRLALFLPAAIFLGVQLLLPLSRTSGDSPPATPPDVQND